LAKRPDLKRLVATWQARLRLQDWEIEAVYVGPDDPGFANHFGDVHPDLMRKFAHMRVLDPNKGEHVQIENTITHELLHLHLFPFTCQFDPGSPEALAEEQAIHAITRALIEGYGKA
jgi:hypothetical protein